MKFIGSYNSISTWSPDEAKQNPNLSQKSLITFPYVAWSLKTPVGIVKDLRSGHLIGHLCGLRRSIQFREIYYSYAELFPISKADTIHKYCTLAKCRAFRGDIKICLRNWRCSSNECMTSGYHITHVYFLMPDRFYLVFPSPTLCSFDCSCNHLQRKYIHR